MSLRMLWFLEEVQIRSRSNLVSTAGQPESAVEPCSGSTKCVGGPQTVQKPSKRRGTSQGSSLRRRGTGSWGGTEEETVVTHLHLS
eukprot:997136-Rhodomonas_salina.3